MRLFLSKPVFYTLFDLGNQWSRLLSIVAQFIERKGVSHVFPSLSDIEALYKFVVLHSEEINGMFVEYRLGFGKIRYPYSKLLASQDLEKATGKDYTYIFAISISPVSKISSVRSLRTLKSLLNKISSAPKIVDEVIDSFSEEMRRSLILSSYVSEEFGNGKDLFYRFTKCIRFVHLTGVLEVELYKIFDVLRNRLTDIEKMMALSDELVEVVVLEILKLVGCEFGDVIRCNDIVVESLNRNNLTVSILGEPSSAYEKLVYFMNTVDRVVAEKAEAFADFLQAEAKDMYKKLLLYLSELKRSMDGYGYV